MNVTDTVTIARFIQVERITMTASRTDRNPNMPDSQDMDHWKVTLRRPGHSMTTYFSMGYGHNGKAPKAAEVLDCLASDANGASDSFEDFCSNFGYDEDSRKAEKIYKACQHSAARLSNFLGSTRYDDLLYHTERK
jgi:hypothetical protein